MLLLLLVLVLLLLFMLQMAVLFVFCLAGRLMGVKEDMLYIIEEMKMS
jgi:hypothetical protein